MAVQEEAANLGIPSLRGGSVDLRSEAGHALRRLNQHLDERLETEGALGALERLQRLGVPSSETSSTGPLAKAMSEAMSGMAKGYQGLSEIQTTMMQQLVGGTQKNSDPMAQMMTVMLLTLLQDRQKPSGGEEEKFWREQFVGLVNSRIEELEGQRGASPLDMQMHEITQRVSAQAMQNMLDPMGQLKQLMSAKETLAGLGFGGDGGQYSPGALQAKALDNQAQGMQYQHMQTVRAADDHRAFLTSGIPMYIAAGGQALRDALASFGLVPVYQNGMQPGAQGAERSFSARARGQEA